jgi:hypothetical protein
MAVYHLSDSRNLWNIWDGRNDADKVENVFFAQRTSQPPSHSGLKVLETERGVLVFPSTISLSGIFRICGTDGMTWMRLKRVSLPSEGFFVPAFEFFWVKYPGNWRGAPLYANVPSQRLPKFVEYMEPTEGCKWGWHG